VRGYALPLVIIFLTILSVSCIAALIALKLSVDGTASVIGRRQAFYQCDDAARIASAAARTYLKSTATPTDADLKLAVCGSTSGCPNAVAYANSGFVVDKLVVSLDSDRVVSNIPNGPFQGMVAEQQDVSIVVQMTKSLTGDRCRVRMSSTVAGLSSMSFFVIVDGYGGFHAPGAMTFDGRVHVNGDACLRASGGGDLVFSRVTVGQQLKTSACTRFAPAAGGGVTRILDLSGTPIAMNSGNESGCTGCGGGPYDWRAYALFTFQNNALDFDHGVPPLKLPAAETAGVPLGKDAGGANSNNVGSMRAVVDPVRATDSPELRAIKLAHLADIRILNGVWYVKDTGNPNAWPGVPIWSDHPGSFNTGNTDGIEGSQNVGQGDLYGGAPPRLYSRYEHIAGTISDDGNGVISYGALAAGGVPGFYNGGAVTPAASAADLVNGMRSGFHDPRVSAAGNARGHILPINFDVAELASALANTTGNELGTKVPTPFNGIVWIGVSWANAHRNGGTPPASWPLVTSVDGGIPPGVAPQVGDALPYNVCGAAVIPGFNGTCGANALRPNAVRIVNAGNLVPFAATGLTIASNGPVYVQGDFGVVGGGGPNGTVASIAGDAVTLLSAGFDDGVHAWGNAPGVTNATGNIQIAASVLAGNVETTASASDGGVENALRLIENWGGRTQTFQGALQVGFRSVFHTQPFSSGVFVSPVRNWKHDPGMASGAVPPGAPRLFVQAVKNWQRD
jgi:hypothetical protein